MNKTQRVLAAIIKEYHIHYSQNTVHDVICNCLCCLSEMLTTRLKVKSFIDLQKISNNKALRVHLAHVQAHLTEQVKYALLTSFLFALHVMADQSPLENECQIALYEM